MDQYIVDSLRTIWGMELECNGFLEFMLIMANINKTIGTDMELLNTIMNGFILECGGMINFMESENYWKVMEPSLKKGLIGIHTFVNQLIFDSSYDDNIKIFQSTSINFLSFTLNPHISFFL